MYYSVTVLLVILIRPGYQSSMSERYIRYNERSCEKFLKEPNYTDTAVVGQVWREYYSWRSFSRKCHVTEFKLATPQIINKFKQDMGVYMVEQPIWADATIMVKKRKYEMLMFPDTGPPGRFRALPNLSRFSDMCAIARDKGMFHAFAMKLLRNNKFLVMLDCRDGIGLLMCRANDSVGEKEVLSVAKEVGIGKGYVGCTSFLKTYYEFV